MDSLFQQSRRRNPFILCKKMKETLMELGIPAYEVPVDKQMVEAHELTVTPTLITYTNDKLGRVHGGRSTTDLKKWISKL